MCRSLYKNCELTVKLWWGGAREKKKCIYSNVYFFYFLFIFFFWHLCFISMYSIYDKLSKYIYFHIPKSIISYTFLLVFKMVKGLQCILTGKVIKGLLMSYNWKILWQMEVFDSKHLSFLILLSSFQFFKATCITYL